MTDIVVVPTLTPLPPYPTPEMDDGPYNAAAFATTVAYVGMVGEMQGMGDATHTNALAAKEQAQAATDAAVAAAQAQDIVLGAANFKGMWVDLVGPLNMPASVKHNNGFWLLTRNVANVAAEVPGVSTAWTERDSGQTVTQKITANTVGIAGVKYLIAAAGIKLTAPTVWNKPDRFGYQLVVPPAGQIVDFGATKVGGVVLGEVELDMPRINDNFQYEDGSLGLIYA